LCFFEKTKKETQREAKEGEQRKGKKKKGSFFTDVIAIRLFSVRDSSPTHLLSVGSVPSVWCDETRRMETIASRLEPKLRWSIMWRRGEGEK
jgi:hypothetical protein